MTSEKYPSSIDVLKGNSTTAWVFDSAQDKHNVNCCVDLFWEKKKKVQVSIATEAI